MVEIGGLTAREEARAFLASSASRPNDLDLERLRDRGEIVPYSVPPHVKVTPAERDALVAVVDAARLARGLLSGAAAALDATLEPFEA